MTQHKNEPDSLPTKLMDSSKYIALHFYNKDDDIEKEWCCSPVKGNKEEDKK